MRQSVSLPSFRCWRDAVFKPNAHIERCNAPSGNSKAGDFRIPSHGRRAAQNIVTKDSRLPNPEHIVGNVEDAPGLP